MVPDIGVVTEQGDLGLGFNPLNEADQKTVQDNTPVKDEDGDDI